MSQKGNPSSHRRVVSSPEQHLHARDSDTFGTLIYLLDIMNEFQLSLSLTPVIIYNLQKCSCYFFS